MNEHTGTMAVLRASGKADYGGLSGMAGRFVAEDGRALDDAGRQARAALTDHPACVIMFASHAEPADRASAPLGYRVECFGRDAARPDPRVGSEPKAHRNHFNGLAQEGENT